MSQSPQTNDMHTNYPIANEKGLLGSDEMYSFRFVSSSSLKNYCRGLEELENGNYDLAKAEFFEGAQHGDPYCLYTMYKMYASENPFNLKPSKEYAWHYLILSAVCFACSIIPEKAALAMLDQYQKKFDNDNFDKSISIIRTDFDDDHSPFVNNKDILENLFCVFLKKNFEKNRDQLLKYFQLEDFNKNLIPLYLRLSYAKPFDSVHEVLRLQQTKEYISEDLKDLIMTFTQTGTLASPQIAQGISEAVFFTLYYIIYMGEETEDEIEDLALEFYKFCSLVIYEDGVKFSGPEKDAVEVIKKFVPFAQAILAYLYTSGTYYEKDLSKAEELIKDCKNPPTDASVTALWDYLVIITKYKIAKANEENQKASDTLNSIAVKYNDESLKKLGNKVMPVDYWIAGYIQEKEFNNPTKAKTFYEAGFNVTRDINCDSEIMGFLAFKSKCKDKINGKNSE